MAEERFDQPTPHPLSERDLGPIEPLTPGKILNIAQNYIAASFHYQRLGRKIEETTGPLDADVLDEYSYQTGRCQALKEVLEELGQGRLASVVDGQVNQMFEQS